MGRNLLAVCLALGMCMSAGAAGAADLRPDGELYEIFKLGSDHTDLQRETKLQEIRGQVVEWELPLYEISRKSDGSYRVITSSSHAVGCIVDVRVTSDAERSYLLGLKTGDRIRFRGSIRGVNFVRSLEIDPATVILPGGSAPEPVVAQPAPRPVAPHPAPRPVPRADSAPNPPAAQDNGGMRDLFNKYGSYGR